jgi:TolB-like protein
MASLIPGYEYDIFISYRQKDNKGERWVSEFVEALKTELESTFKEEISVYFDINPHDGLLETHDVDASLKEKLKCLVFIPIISQTYCDSKSFAWQHEFVSFNKMAKEDSFGRDIKLTGGNVASRILPVKIHDLDPEDKSLLENELGGVLRSIDFIYKSAGVNRPLRTNEDHPQDNLNKTYYRDQINKVANAVKEIITAIKKHDRQDGETTKDIVKTKTKKQRKQIPKIIIISFLVLALILLGYFFIPKLFESSESIKKSIAVLPFLNYSTEPDQEAMSEGLTDEIINHLFKIKSIDKVVSLRNVLPYKGTNKNILQIANELDVNYILDGTYKKIGDQVKIRATLIEPKKDNRLWQDEYNRPYEDLITIQADISLQIANKLNAILSNSELQNIQKVPTTNQQAYELVQKAVYLTRSEKELDQILDLALNAIKLDTSYADAYAIAGIMTLYNGVYAGSKEILSAILDALPFLEKALELDQNNAWAHFAMGNINEWGRWDYIKAEQEYLKAIEIEPNRVETNWDYYLIGEFFLKMRRLESAQMFLDKAKDFGSAETSDISIKINALSGNKKEAYDLIKNSNPETGREYKDKWTGEDYIWLQEYDSAKIYLESAIKFKDPSMLLPRFQAYLALAYFKTKKNQKARTILNQLEKKSSETIVGSPEYFTGWYYSGIGEIDSAFLWLEKAFKNKSPELPWLKTDPVFNNLKKDPRYWDLYARTGHKAYDDYIAVMKKR